MSFLDPIFRPTVQAKVEECIFDHPIADIFGHTPRAQAMRSKDETLAREAAMYWKDQMSKLADQHAEAINATVAMAFNLTEAGLKRIVEENDNKLKIAHRLLLQQSDIRWSKSITNEALNSLGHSCHRIRIDAEE